MLSNRALFKGLLRPRFLLLAGGGVIGGVSWSVLVKQVGRGLMTVIHVAFYNSCHYVGVVFAQRQE